MESEPFKDDVPRAEDDKLMQWLKLIRDYRWSRRQKHELLNEFGVPESIYQASFNHLMQAVSGRVKAQSILFDIELLDRQIAKDLDWMSCNNASLVTILDSNYPSSLKQIDDPPLALFILGDVSLLNEPQVAIVGSRKPTPVGAKVARELATGLSNLGIVVTSGMALGIDGLAHQGALDNRSATVAVMGCGLDTVYPQRHVKLCEQIRSEGLLVSEYPIGVKPSRYTFPERNRIVSGMSIGVVIVEAAKKSGTLITARLAMEQNREVMVLPGSALSRQYDGSHQLIKNGAALVTTTEDVLFVLKNQLERVNLNIDGCETHQDKGSRVKEIGSSNNDVRKSDMLALIGAESVSIETLIIESGLTPANVSSMLLELELEGRVGMSDDGGYINID